MRAVNAVVVAFVLAAACSEPRVAEDRAAACANEIDDDGDGLIDCDDPDCAATEACERTESTCSNTLDDDGNGSIDCRQDSCKALPICRDAVESACQLRPTAEGSGCPRGKGCYITPDNRRWCALEGPSLAGGPCGDDTDPSDRSRGCAAGYLCGDDKRCARICADAYDCTRNSICRVVGTQNGDDVRACSLSCFRSSDCRADEDCVPFQRTDGIPIEKGGWAHRCVARASLRDPGTAVAGDPCREDAEVCAGGLLCIPEPGGARCRTVCEARRDGIGDARTCPAGASCYAVVPFSGQAERFDEQSVIGVCL